MTREDLIDLDGNLVGFFNEAVGDAVRSRDCTASDATLYYLVSLLADYARPQSLQRAIFDKPFTFLLHDALRTTGPGRFEKLRTLGDDVLYVSGFFGDHLTRRGVELGFVAGLGSRAYDEAAAVLRLAHSSQGAPDVLSELSSHFAQFVEVLSEVADVAHARAARGPQAMLDVYQRWMKTGSTALAGALTRWGVLPREASGTIH